MEHVCLCVKIMRIVQPVCMPAVAERWSLFSFLQFLHFCVCLIFMHFYFGWILVVNKCLLMCVCVCVCVFSLNSHKYRIYFHATCICPCVYVLRCLHLCVQARINMHVCVTSMRIWAHRDDPLPWFPPCCSSAELHFRIQILLVSESETRRLTLWASLLPLCLLLFSSLMKCIMHVWDSAIPRFLLFD